MWEKRVYFNCDFNQDGILSLTEQAKGEIADLMMKDTMDKSSWGRPRQVRLGVEFTF